MFFIGTADVPYIPISEDRGFTALLISRTDCTKDGFPALSPVDVTPQELQGFNYAKSTTHKDKSGKACHFFLDDYQFERVWTRPKAYTEVLRGYDCVLTPDFSLYMDMPDAMQRWNRYRSQAVGLIWQRAGLVVVPTLSWAQPETYKYAFSGIPKHSTVATSTVGIKRDKSAQAIWRDGMSTAIKALEPSRVLLYGENIDFDFGNIELIEYKAGGFHGR